MVTHAMQMIQPSNHAFHKKALIGSLLLHGLCMAWVLTPDATPDTMPEVMIEVSLVAMPKGEADAPKTLAMKKQQAEPLQKKTEQPKPEISREVAKIAADENTLAKEVAETKTTEPTPSHVSAMNTAETLAEISPKAGAASASDAVQTASKPIFDAAYLQNPAPNYPTQAKRRRLQGSVMLDVLVSADGTPLSVQVAESSGHALLDSAAREAVVRWKFVPAKRSGAPVDAQVIVPIEFKLS